MDASAWTLLRDTAHLLLHLLDFSSLWTGKSPGCPDCVCPVCQPVIQERVPEALTSALSFAQQHCLGTVSTPSTSTNGWTFTLFWWGVLVGSLVTSLTWSICLVVYRAWLCAFSSSATSPSPTSARPRPSLADAGDEPANPRTLRELGIIR